MADMKHLFTNWDGELVAADNREQAAAYYNESLGVPSFPDELTKPKDWRQLSDQEPVSIWSEETGERITTTKPAKDWAAEFNQPMLAASTYA